jgi:DNA ligase (NAD+)
LSLGRDSVHDWIRSKGGEVKTGVSKTLNYLVTNDTSSGSSKNKKAVDLGVKIINEDELKKLGNVTSF